MRQPSPPPIVVRGSPTDEELAATLALFAMIGGSQPVRATGRARWRQVTYYHQPGAWTWTSVPT